MHSGFPFQASRAQPQKRVRDAPTEGGESGFSDILDEFSRIQKENAELAQAVRLEKYRRDEADNNLQKLQNRFNDLSAVILEHALRSRSCLMLLCCGVERKAAEHGQHAAGDREPGSAEHAVRDPEQSDAPSDLRRELREDEDPAQRRASRVYDFDSQLLKPRDVEIDFDAFLPEEERSERETSRDAAHAQEVADLHKELAATQHHAESTAAEKARATELKRKYYGQLRHLKQVLKDSYNISVTIDPYETDCEEQVGQEDSAAMAEVE
eukprot:scaffold48_cov311-Pinguiococcus_pyrenoidosus.AAC.337